MAPVTLKARVQAAGMQGKAQGQVAHVAEANRRQLLTWWTVGIAWPPSSVGYVTTSPQGTVADCASETGRGCPHHRARRTVLMTYLWAGGK